MRSIYLILGCCLMFSAVMIMGICMQSCKSKRSMEKSEQVDSIALSACKEEMDSFTFRRLLERRNKSWTMEVLQYRPIFDSAGKVTDTYLEKRIQLSHRHEKERDSSVHHVMMQTKENNTDVQVSKESESKEEPAPKYHRIFLFLVLAFLLYLKIRR